MFLIKFQEYFEKLYSRSGAFTVLKEIYFFYCEGNVHGNWIQRSLTFSFFSDVIFKGHAKIDKIYMVKFNVTVLNRSRLIKFYEI